MTKVCCENCMVVFSEQKAVWDGADKTEYCPECGEGGCLVRNKAGAFPTPKQLERLRDIYRNGTMVRLVAMSDPYSKLKPGDRGVIKFVDDAGGIHTAWRNGENLAAIWCVDRLEVIS